MDKTEPAGDSFISPVIKPKGRQPARWRAPLLAFLLICGVAGLALWGVSHVKITGDGVTTKALVAQNRRDQVEENPRTIHGFTEIKNHATER